MGMIALTDSGFDLAKTMETISEPLKFIVGLFEKFPNLMKWVIWWKAWNTILPMTTGLIWGLNGALSYMLARMTGISQIQMFGALNMGGMSGAMLLPAVINRGGTVGTFTGSHQMQAIKKRMAERAVDLKNIKNAKNVSQIGRIGMGMQTTGKLARFIPGWGTLLAMLLMGGGLAASQMQGGGYITPRSHGGMAGAGSPYLVGEQGPELFVPSQGGQVLNTASTSNIGSNMQFRNVTIGIDSFGGLA
jgi:hypothetical protein